MNCPNCQTVMREREKGDIVIDVCPNCRGMWLDAGELEKIVTAEQRLYERRGWDYDDDDDDDDDRRRGYDRRRDEGRRPDDRYAKPQKKKSFFSNLLETFGEGGAGDD